MNIFTNTVFFFFFLLVAFTLEAAKTDTVFLYNGDKLTGEIKSLELGKLKFSTDHIGVIYIEWDQILTIDCKQNLEFTYANGMLRYGMMYPSLTMGAVYVDSSRKNLVKLIDIVELVPIKNTFWSRVDGKVELGVSYTKANENLQLNADFNIEYRGKNFVTGFRTSNLFTDRPEIEQTQKTDVSLYFSRLILNRWHLDGKANGERNTELGLDYRVLAGGSVGRDLIRGLQNRLSIGTGVFWNGEKGIDTTLVTKSVEAAGILTFRKLRYNTPKLDVYSQFTVFPSLTEKGRVRAQYDLNTDFEVIKDLFIGVKFYFTYDNQPRSETASDRDYGIRSTIGYKF